MDWVNLICQILSGLVVLIPLVYKLIDYVIKAGKEKNWQAYMKLLYEYIMEAESKFTNGADKKDWVMDLAEASGRAIGYELDSEELSKLIDGIITVTKKVNTEGK